MLKSTTVESIMTTDMVSVAPEDGYQNAARLLLEHGIMFARQHT
jgi:CBS-domain-containing membrane protein